MSRCTRADPLAPRRQNGLTVARLRVRTPSDARVRTQVGRAAQDGRNSNRRNITIYVQKPAVGAFSPFSGLFRISRAAPKTSRRPTRPKSMPTAAVICGKRGLRGPSSAKCDSITSSVQPHFCQKSGREVTVDVSYAGYLPIFGHDGTVRHTIILHCAYPHSPVGRARETAAISRGGEGEKWEF